MSTEKVTVSLVLGSGGARGIVHIGVIKCLLDRGFDIRYISGSSMGALIGGIYATGQLDVYEHWLCALQRRDVLSLLDLSFTRQSLFKGERIIQVLKEMIGDCNIEDLPIGFTAVATDVNEQREIWFSRGPLFDAIRASIAVPMVFSPVVSRGRLLVDGGLINPVPIAPTLNDETDLTIAVDLNATREKIKKDQNIDAVAAEESNGYRQAIVSYIDNLRHKTKGVHENSIGTFDLINKSLSTVQTAITQLKLGAYPPDLLIEIPRNLCAFFDFDQASELIAFGYKRTEESLDRYEQIEHKRGQ